MISDHQLHQIVNFLRSKKIKMSVENEWLKGCCGFYELSEQRENIGDIHNFVYEQWLLADLRDIGESSLPTDLSIIRCAHLNETYALQVNEILDVGESCYSQLQKIRNESTNAELLDEKSVLPTWQSKRSRLFKLTLTDGLQTIYGMEYEYIAALKEPFVPGFKILVVGPVECRLGVLFLNSRNVQILGGEADSLIISNATENILARILNLNENPDPFDGMSPKMANTNETSARVDQTTSDQEQTTDQMNEIMRTNSNNELTDEEIGDDILLCEQLTRVENQYSTKLPRSNMSVAVPVKNVRKLTSRRSGETEPVGVDNRCSSSLAHSDLNVDGNKTDNRSNENDLSMINCTCDIFGFEDRCYNERTLNNVGPFRGTLNAVGGGIVNCNAMRMPFVDSVPPLSSNESKKDKPLIVGVACPIVVGKQDATLSSSALPPRSEKARTGTRVVGPSFDTSENISSDPAVLPIQLTVRELRDSVFKTNTLRRFVVHSISVAKLISKPRIRHTKWHVLAEIMDDTAACEVVFGDAFLEKYIFGISAFEISSQKDRMMLNLNVKERIDQLLRTGVEKILSLTGNFLMEITSDNTPTVVDVTL